MPSRFIPVMRSDELWDGEMQGREVSGRKLLLVKLDGRVCAYEDRCAHLGMALSEGELVGGEIVCGAHHYRYDARTGRGVNPKNVQLKPLSVVLEGEMIAVALETVRQPEDEGGT